MAVPFTKGVQSWRFSAEVKNWTEAQPHDTQSLPCWCRTALGSGLEAADQCTSGHKWKAVYREPSLYFGPLAPRGLPKRLESHLHRH